MDYIDITPYVKPRNVFNFNFSTILLFRCTKRKYVESFSAIPYLKELLLKDNYYSQQSEIRIIINSSNYMITIFKIYNVV